MTRSVGIWSLIFVTTLIVLSTGCARKTTPESTAQMGASGPSAEEIRAREEEERRKHDEETKRKAGEVAKKRFGSEDASRGGPGRLALEADDDEAPRSRRGAGPIYKAAGRLKKTL